MTSRPNPAGLRVVDAEQRRVRPSIAIDRLAGELGMPVKSLRRLIEKGQIEGFYGGRTILVFLDSVADYQEAARVPVKPENGPGPRPKREKTRRASPGETAAVEYLRSIGVNLGT